MWSGTFCRKMILPGWQLAGPRLRVFCVLHVLLAATVYGQQKFTKEPRNQSVAAGTLVIMECTVENLVSQVQWKRGPFLLGTGRELPWFPRYEIKGSESLGEHNLVIADTQLEDDAAYECQVMATERTAALRSHKAVLTVLLPPDEPQIEKTPKVEVVAGVTTNLTCTAKNGKPAASVKWKFSGKTMDSTFYSITTQSDGKRQDAVGKLTITPQKTDQQKTYTCEVINDALRFAKTTEVKLEVLYMPEVSMTVLPNSKLREGGAVRFTCVGKGNPNVITWRWFKEDVIIGGATKSQLEIMLLTPDYHRKKITCEATNKVGSTNSSFPLMVEFGPRFISPGQHQAVDLGGEVMLSCLVDGNPNPSVRWTRKNSNRILGTNKRLTISNVKNADFGVYVCTATVWGFKDVSQEIHLLKNGPPKVVSKTEQYAIFGEKGKVECETQSVPQPKAIRWQKDGSQLDVKLLDRYTLVEQELPNGKRSVLEIETVQYDDYGLYNCSVENGYGQDYLVINFERKDSIPLTYILLGVLAGVILIVLIAVALFLYHRRKASDKVSESDLSEASKKKEDFTPNPVDTWKTDYPQADKNIYARYSVEYDELSYPGKDPKRDYRDGYNGNLNNFQPDYTRDYGTYPGPARYENNYTPSSFGSDYGSYRQAVPPQNYPPSSGYRSPPNPPSSRLSTNV